MPLPDVAKFAQRSGIVVHTGRRHHAQGMKFGAILVNRLAVLILEFGKARDNASAITKHADSATFPVALFGLV